MIFKNIKDRSLQKGIDKLLEKRSSQSIKAVPLKTLAVLIDASKDINVLSLVRVADELGVRSANLKLIAFKEDFDEKEGHIGEANYFNAKGISVNGNFKSPFLKDFVSKEYDVLINFYAHNDNLIINYVAAASKAKFKVGYAEVDHRINDLVISSAQGKTNLFISELKKYLKILKIV